MNPVAGIISQSAFSPSDLVQLLLCEGAEQELLLQRGGETRQKFIGNKIYLRGLVEFTNSCEKDCFYCGIRHSNSAVRRYNLSDQEILESARYALGNRFGSVVLQSGENSSPAFALRVTRLIEKIKQLSNGQLGVTLSVGEQKREVYRQWFEAGAHRYLLRIETTNPLIYKKIHPDNKLHDFYHRLDCLHTLRSLGYQTGTGVMIGLPFQTATDLANDLLFFQQLDVDMVGMGPYLEHSQTPLIAFEKELLPLRERFDLTLKMIAILRIIMKDINIVASTALQVIDPLGREKGINAGANIIMPNITPVQYRNDYTLYDNKPCSGEQPLHSVRSLEATIVTTGNEIGYGEWGDPVHFKVRKGLEHNK